MGKASVRNITVSLGLVVIPKGLAMAHLSVVASPLAILPPSTSLFLPLAPYCPISWHLTAKTPPRLAPYCSPPTATLLLLTGWHPTATLRLAPYCYSSNGLTLPWFRLLVVSYCLRAYCPTPWIKVMTSKTARVVIVGPRFPCFLPSTITYPLPSGQGCWSSNRRFLFFWGAC